MAKGPDFVLANAARETAPRTGRDAPRLPHPRAAPFPRTREPTLRPPTLPYRPTNDGGRFSANAVCPSRRSSVSASIAEQRCSY